MIRAITLVLVLLLVAPLAEAQSILPPGIHATQVDTSAVVQQSPLPVPVCTSSYAVSIVADTQIITGVAGQRTYFCAVLLIANAAETVSLVEGTGSVCATGKTAIIGSATDAEGMSFAANGGLVALSDRPWGFSTRPGNNICLMLSGTNRVTGVITYVNR